MKLPALSRSRDVSPNMAIQTLFGSVPQEPSLLDRLKEGIEKTRTGLVDRIEELSGRQKRSMPIFSTSSNMP